MITTGNYVTGCGEAHLYGADHIPAFGCPMVGTFNVRVPDGFDLWNYRMARETPASLEDPVGRRYWLVKLDDQYYAWALRWGGSHMPASTLELLSKRPLPDSLKRDGLKVEILERWPDAEIERWAGANYQFQGFDWLAEKRADSALVWNTIEPRAKWAGADVLDVGSHYGYHSHRASRLGANVVAGEPEYETQAAAVLINDHIEMDDVEFDNAIPAPDPFDIVLYLSVQHQWDESYEFLEMKSLGLSELARQCVFVELILPPMFGGSMTEADVDAAVGGEVLLTYKHKVRGTRRIYWVPGKA